MKYTIEGFSQQAAIEFRRTDTVNGKEKVIKLDCTDLVILRWFVDFYPNMTKVEANGRQYAWVNYESLIEDMPLLGFGKEMLAVRMKKLVSFGILDRYTMKNGGTFSYYGFGPEYMRLVSFEHGPQTDSIPTKNISDPLKNISEGVSNIFQTPMKNISEQTYPSTKDPSTKDNPLKTKGDAKKQSPQDLVAEVDAFTDNVLLRQTILEFMDARRAMKAPMTMNALKKMLSKLKKLAYTDDERIEILNNSIINGWKGVFPLKGNERRQQNGEQFQMRLEEYSRNTKARTQVVHTEYVPREGR